MLGSEGRSEPLGCRWLQSSFWEVPGRGAAREVPREGAMWGPGACKAPNSCRGGDFLLKFQVHFGSHSRVLGCRLEVVSEVSVFSPLSLPCLTLRPSSRESWSPCTSGSALLQGVGDRPSSLRKQREQETTPPATRRRTPAKGAAQRGGTSVCSGAVSSLRVTRQFGLRFCERPSQESLKTRS